MSANVKDRVPLSLVINSIIANNEVIGEQEETEINCQECFNTGWKRILVNNVPGVVRCKASHYFIEKFIQIGGYSTHKHCSFFNYIPKSIEQEEAKEVSKDFVSSFVNYGHQQTKSLILSGCENIGKTHLSVAIVKELLLASKFSIDYDDFFNAMFSLISDLEQVNLEAFQHYTGDESWAEELPPDFNKKRDKFFYENYLGKELLVLDNFGFEHVSDIEESIFSHIVAHRYNNRLPMILTTRLSLDEIENGLAPTTFSKLMDFGQFVCLS